MTRRRLAAMIVASVAWLAPGVAHADAAAPTDYRTTIVSVTPQIPGLEVSIEGGDSFVRVRAPEGSEVVVFGYAGEPYLRITADGTVATNRLSASTYENERRYGGTEVPAFVDFRAEPEWVTIGSGDTWAWHDHRSHWMDSEPLIGLDPGESLPVQTIPITVDGQQVVIAVETTLIAEPSWLPAAIGGLIGLQLIALGWWLGPATATMTTMLLALAALVTGGGQYLSLPAETGPLLTWWLLPAVAAVAGVAAIATYGRSRLLLHGLLVLAGVQLFIWGFLRRDGLTKPVLPTDIAFWFDRATTSAAIVGGATIAVLATRSVLSRPPGTASANSGDVAVSPS